MKKIIKNYENFIFHEKASYQIYKRIHKNFYNWLIHRKKKFLNISPDEKELLSKIPTGRSIWIDSFGHAFYKLNTNIISFENKFYNYIFKKIKEEKKIYTTNNFFLKTNFQILKKLNPTSLVFYYSSIFRYVSIEEFTNHCNLFSNWFQNIKIIILFDIQFIDFNKIKMSNQEAIKELQKKINYKNSFSKKNNRDYMLELNS